MAKVDLVCIGEVLVDFLADAQMSEGVSISFTGNPGGAPANVAVGASRLGLSAAFIGKVGDDVFGNHLRRVLVGEHVDVKGLVMDKSERTTLAFVSLDESGDRSFTFYRNPGSDSMLRSDELDLGLIGSCRALVHGSISLIDEPSRSATLAAVKAAEAAGAAILFDPNLRKALWQDISSARQAIFDALVYSDLVKVSDEELMELTYANSVEDGLAELRKIVKKDAIIAVSMGARGSMVDAAGLKVISGGFPVDAVDATGAGDSFLAALIFGIALTAKGAPLKSAMEYFTESDWTRLFDLANAGGALCATRKGAIPALPYLSELKSFLSSHGKEAVWLG